MTPVYVHNPANIPWIAANIAYEHAVTLYIAVQSFGVLVLSGFAEFPALARRAAIPRPSDSDMPVGSVSPSPH